MVTEMATYRPFASNYSSSLIKIHSEPLQRNEAENKAQLQSEIFGSSIEHRAVVSIPNSINSGKIDREKVIRFKLEESYSAEWKFVQPMPVSLEFDDEIGSYIISDELFVEYGVGDDFEQAKENYAENLISYYQFLAGKNLEDDPESQQLFEKLNEYLQQTRP